ncbi:glycosyltransferase family 2 protein [Membranihabitans maritimus]|uniref:glycosyltransferase family 2 protein n=1 Tax=Membranihabitans maritimus TaxID=2904244 RepID=UPI001F158BFE|nr:glycosyltransferase family 2 protein [Membranihabitans maritimus]
MNREEFLEKYQKVPVREYNHEVGTTPMVSVCVQTYQHQDFIRQCLDGILMQETTFDIEILLGEDNSVDGTRDICTEYAKKYPDKIRLFLHHRENNISVSDRPTGRFNFTYNLFSARGKYIAICEGDDYWTDPLKLQKQVDFLESHPDYVICGHDAFIFDEKGTVQESKLPDSNKRDFHSEDLQIGVFILTLSACFRNVIEDIPPHFMRVLNADSFLFSYLGQFGHYKYMPEIKPAAYRVHEGGMWSLVQKQEKLISNITTKYWKAMYFQSINKNEIKEAQMAKIIINIIDSLGQFKWRTFFQLLYHITRAIIKTKFPIIFQIKKSLERNSSH